VDIPDSSGGGTAIDAYCYVDESRQAEGRYGAVCAVSVSASQADQIAQELRAALGELSEFKFNETSDGRQKRAGLKMLEVAFQYVEKGALKIDTLSWDRHDSRHSVAGRDDYANLERMLYHRLVWVILRWPEHRTWYMMFDRQDQIDDKQVARTVNARLRKETQGELSGVFSSTPEILYSQQVDSKDFIFIQVADLFAGLAAYLRDLDPRDYKAGSKATRNRAELIDSLLAWLAAHGIAYFSPGEGIITAKNAPVNFWPYRPQGDYDRCPTRASKTEPRLVICIAESCDEFVYDEYGFQYPRCQLHYSEYRRENEEAERRAEAARLEAEGSHYCERCFSRVTPTEAMMRANQRTWEDEYRHPKCGGLLVQISPFIPEADPTCVDRDLSRKPERERPDVRLDRQSYRDDD
jgi:hypothetical protein